MVTILLILFFSSLLAASLLVIDSAASNIALLLNPPDDEDLTIPPANSLIKRISVKLIPSLKELYKNAEKLNSRIDQLRKEKNDLNLQIAHSKDMTIHDRQDLNMQKASAKFAISLIHARNSKDVMASLREAFINILKPRAIRIYNSGKEMPVLLEYGMDEKFIQLSGLLKQNGITEKASIVSDNTFHNESGKLISYYPISSEGEFEGLVQCFSMVASRPDNERVKTLNDFCTAAAIRMKDIKASSNLSKNSSDQRTANLTFSLMGLSQAISRLNTLVNSDTIANYCIEIMTGILGREKTALYIYEGENSFRLMQGSDNSFDKNILLNKESDDNTKNSADSQNGNISDNLNLKIPESLIRSKLPVISGKDAIDKIVSLDDSELDSLLILRVVNSKLLGIVVSDSGSLPGLKKDEELCLLEMTSNILSFAMNSNAYRHQLMYETRAKNQAINQLKKREVLAEEFKMAGKIQESLMPEAAINIENTHLTGITIPVLGVGGDFYDWINTGDAIYAIIADVSGKGLSGALVMSMARTVWRMSASHNESLKSIAQLLHHSIVEAGSGRFMTGVLIRYENGKLQMLNAGHVPVVLSENDKVEEVYQSTGPPFGLIEDMEYGLYDLELKPGQRLTLCSDGLTEARNKKSEFLGFEKFKELVIKHSDLSPETAIEKMKTEVEKFTGDNNFNDDFTILMLEKRKVEE